MASLAREGSFAAGWNALNQATIMQPPVLAFFASGIDAKEMWVDINTLRAIPF